MKKTIITTLIFFCALLSACATTKKPIQTNQQTIQPAGTCKNDIKDLNKCPQVKEFITKHSNLGYSQDQLKQFFSTVQYVPAIASSTANPAEKKSWAWYKEKYVSKDRINNGVDFYRRNKQVLLQATKGKISPFIVVATLGAETNYGRFFGKNDAFNTLAIQSFFLNDRPIYFRKQLAAFLELTAKTKEDPLSIESSYAGALGGGQLMPSAALDFIKAHNNSKVADLYDTQNPTIMIESIVYYYTHHHLGSSRNWDFGKKIVTALPLSASKDAGVVVLSDNNKQVLEVWKKQENFDSIRAYNPSNNYTMAIYQLAQAIKDHAQGSDPSLAKGQQTEKNKSAGLLKQKAITHHGLTHKTS